MPPPMILLAPRAADAYGQDFLSDTLVRGCGLSIVRPTDGEYRLPTESPALVVCQNPEDPRDARLLSMLPAEVPVVAHVHCNFAYYTAEQQRTLTQSLSRATHGVALGAFHLADLHSRFPDVKWRLVHNGVDPDRYHPSTSVERDEFRRSQGIGSDELMVLCVGRLDVPKGQQILEQLAPLLADTNITIVLQYLANSETALRRYKCVAEEILHKGAGRVRLLPDANPAGPRPVRFADVLISPSLSEAAPMVVLEALACGVPAIVTESTPFYRELKTLGLSDDAIVVLPFPPGSRTGVERSSLGVDRGAAKSLASDFLAALLSSRSPSDSERLDRASALRRIGLTHVQMTRKFIAIYQEAAQPHRTP